MDKINMKNLTDDELEKLKDGDLSYLKLPEAPYNLKHAHFLSSLKIVEGVTNHGLLFQQEEELNPEDDEDLEKKIMNDLNALREVNSEKAKAMDHVAIDLAF